ncbi:MAG: hypothetical protein MUP58_01690 [Candidatus Nanohaloarchaeota archaeon QJJ-9]|nr:hypothetical protein [Candidatus Nanohaloarchaeota archaeon QJJ-9]
MKKGRQSKVLVALLGFMIVSGVVLAAEPHHPLSQIYPMDEPLNLSGQPISDVGGITECGPDEALLGDGSCGSTGGGSISGDYWVNETGDTMTGTLNMSQNNITGLPSPVDTDHPITLGYGQLNYFERTGDSMGGNLDMATYNITGAGNIGIGTNNPDAKLDIEGGNLDMNGNNITGIGGLNNCGPNEALLGDGSCGSTGGGSISGDYWVNETGDNMTGTLNMSGNKITGVASLEDASGDSMLNFDDANNDVEVQGGFQLPVGTDAW